MPEIEKGWERELSALFSWKRLHFSVLRFGLQLRVTIRPNFGRMALPEVTTYSLLYEVRFDTSLGNGRDGTGRPAKLTTYLRQGYTPFF